MRKIGGGVYFDQIEEFSDPLCKSDFSFKLYVLLVMVNGEQRSWCLMFQGKFLDFMTN